MFPTVDRVSHTYACGAYFFYHISPLHTLSFFQPAHHVSVSYMTGLTVRNRLSDGLMFTPEKCGIATCLF